MSTAALMAATPSRICFISLSSGPRTAATMQNSLAPVLRGLRAPPRTSDGMSSQTPRTGEENRPGLRAEVAVLRAAAGLERHDPLDLDLRAAPAHPHLVRELERGFDLARRAAGAPRGRRPGQGRRPRSSTWSYGHGQGWRPCRYPTTTGSRPHGAQGVTAAADARRGAALRRRAQRAAPARGRTRGRSRRQRLPRPVERSSSASAAAAEALSAYGLGATGSRLVRGTTDAARRARGGAGRVDRASSARWSSRRATWPTSAPSARWPARADTLIVSDAHCHASMIDGCRMVRAPRRWSSPHADAGR